MKTRENTNTATINYNSEKFIIRMVDDMTDVLKENGWESSRDALETIVEEWFEQKKHIIDVLSKHPNWNPEQLCVVIDNKYTRPFDENVVYEFANFVRNAYNSGMSARIAPASQKQLCEDMWSKVKETPYVKGEWDDDEATGVNEWVDKMVKLVLNNGGGAIKPEFVEDFNEWFPADAKAGQKVSRYINKVLTLLGVNKMISYYDWKYFRNRESERLTYDMARVPFFDGINPIMLPAKTIISVNPLDYLLMSNGNSWASCHTIDLEDDRPNNYDHCYCGGTLSYMLDNVTFVTYTVNPKYDGGCYATEQKILRQMWQMDGYKLCQQRLYPQSNDSMASNVLRDEIRGCVQSVIAKCLDINNLWVIKRISPSNSSDYYKTGSNSAHYEDYYYYGSVISYPKEVKDEVSFDYAHRVVIGAERISITSGRRFGNGHSDSNTLASENNVWSAYEDEYIDEDDSTWVESVNSYISGRTLRREFTYCDRCHTYHLDEETSLVATRQGTNEWCNECVEDYAYSCHECGELCSEDVIHWDEWNDDYYCNDCFEDLKESREAKEA